MQLFETITYINFFFFNLYLYGFEHSIYKQKQKTVWIKITEKLQIKKCQQQAIDTFE